MKQIIYISCNVWFFFTFLQASMVNHLMEHVPFVSHHANSATLLSPLNAPAVQWANSSTCINACLLTNAQQAHMQIPHLGYAKIAKLDVLLAAIPLF